MISIKPKLRTVSPDDLRLRTEFIGLKFIYGTLLLLWLGAIVIVTMYESLPNFAKVFLWVVIWIICPDIKSTKLLFSNFEAYRRHEINESITHISHAALQFGLYQAMMLIKSKYIPLISPDDPRLRIEFISSKFIGGTILLFWLGAVVALIIMYGSLPDFTKFLLGAVIVIIYPDLKGVKLLFSNFEAYRRHKIESMDSDSDVLH